MAKVNPSEVIEEPKKKKHKSLTPFSLDSINPNFYLGSGCLALDCLLGNADADPEKPQGIGSGRMLEAYGPNKSAKSEISQCFIREAIKAKLDVIYFDQEWSADSRKLGVTEEEWQKYGVIYRAATLEEFYAQSYEELDKVMAKQKANGTFMTPKAKGIVIVLDSMAAIKSEQETLKEVGGTKVIAGSAILNSEELPKLRRAIGITHSILIWVNQTRNKPMIGGGGGNPETTPGGEAPRFYADYRIRLAYAGSLWLSSGKAAPKLKAGKRKKPDGFVSAAKMIKNKLAPPMAEEELAVFFTAPTAGGRSGLSSEWTLFYSLQSRKRLNSAGGKYKLFGETFTRSEWPSFLEAHYDKLRDLYYKLLSDTAPASDADDDDDDDDDDDE